MSTQRTNLQASNPSAPLLLEANLTYEQLLNADRRFAMDEGSLFFDDKGRVQETLRRITMRLNDLAIPYAVAGGMCLYHHGFRRYTEDVDLLVTREGLKQIHQHLEGLGFVRLFAGSKGMRDANTRVKIDFLLEGEYPGDGKPKPISFPQPQEVSEEFDGIRYLTLATLVNLKLASGLSNDERKKDLVDVEEICKALKLPIEFAQQLHPSVQGEFCSIWQRFFGKRKRFVLIWDPISDSQSQSLGELISDGVFIDESKQVAEGLVYLVTTDPALAEKYNMQPEDEFFFDK